MNNFQQQQLLENISIQVHYAINEAYDNMLLEEYNIQPFIDTIIDQVIKVLKSAYKTTKDAHIEKKLLKLCKILRKILILIIKEIKESEGYAKVKEFLNNLRKEIIKTIKNHNKLTPLELLRDIKTSLRAIGMFSAGALTTYFNMAKNEMDQIDPETEITVKDLTLGNDSIKTNNTDSLSNNFDVSKKNISLLKALPQNFGTTPADYASKHECVMTPSKKCMDFIKDDEVLCLFPYYATKIEQKAGKVTIGWGHVICDNYKSDKGWYFPKGMSAQRKKELKQQIRQMAQNNIIKISSVKYDANGNKFNANKDKKMKNLISKVEAQSFFDSDIKTVDRRIKITLGITKSANNSFDLNRTINPNVKYYCYFNQDIYDLLSSCVFNCGALNQKNDIIITLTKCNYDKNTQAIRESDFNILKAKFKKAINSDRRIKEVNTFIANNDILKKFSQILNA